MKSLLVLVLAICSVQCLNGKYEKDKAIFHAFLQEIYGNEFDMDEYIEIAWPTIQQLVPVTVDLPGVEMYYKETDEYMCATATTAQVKVGDILNKKLVFQSKEKYTYEVECELIHTPEPVHFGVAKKLGPSTSSPTIPVSYKFNKPSKIRFILEINNFRGTQDLTPQCVMEVKNVMVVELSPPESLVEVADAGSRKIVEEYEESLGEDNAAMIGTVGLVKVVNDSLKSHTNFLLCPSKSFKNVVEKYEIEWEYSDNYYIHCLKTKKN